MISDQQIIEILAKREGWTYIKSFGNTGIPPNPDPSYYVLQVLPSYLSSLDTLAPILATLTEEEFRTFWMMLCADVALTYSLSNWAGMSPEERFYHCYTKAKPHQLALCIFKVIGGGE